MRALFAWPKLRAVVLAVLVLPLGCSKQSPAPAPAPAPEELSPPDFAATLPEVPGPHGYAGSTACQDCHQDQFASWHRTYHRTMTQIASEESIQADFNNVILTNENTRFTLSRRGDEHWVRMEGIAPASGGLPEPVEVRLGLVTGSHHMQVFWVPEGHGNLQIGFPFTWLIPEKRWVPREATFIRPPGLSHSSEAWNIVCSRCHATGVEPHFDAATRTVETRVGELGIACEACHGPGQRHAALRLSAPEGSAALQPGEIIHPEKLSAERASQICGFCHSMKWIDASENWREAGFQYRPGEDLEASTPIIRAATIDLISGLPEYLERNPELMRDFFWEDGMIRVSGREFNGLLDSPCFKGGKFSCLSCHSGHPREPNDMLAEIGQSNSACTQCHEEFRDAGKIAAHTRHSLGSSGSECYNCHMPHTTYGVLKAIRSHQVSSPGVAADLATGRPNACNLCHLDQTLGWTAGHLSKWYQQESPALPAHATNTAHALRLAIAGDAAQRALIGWHLGWAPAQQISGTNWIAPLLGQLLDDPYAAVRLVAERSLQNVPGISLPNYDYTVAPEAREPAREIVWSRWQRQSLDSARAGGDIGQDRARRVLAWPEDLAAQRAAYDQLLGWRDHRPVRLRE